MGRLYLLFKTDEFVVKDIVAVHESLEVVLHCSKIIMGWLSTKNMGKAGKLT